MSIESDITEAVNLAGGAWDKNSDLRKLFGSAKPDKNYPLPIIGGNVGLLLKKINGKKQILVKEIKKHGALAHAVSRPNDYFAKLFNENYAIRETILVDFDFIRNVRTSVTFKNAKADAAKDY